MSSSAIFQFSSVQSFVWIALVVVVRCSCVQKLLSIVYCNSYRCKVLPFPIFENKICIAPIPLNFPVYFNTHVLSKQTVKLEFQAAVACQTVLMTFKSVITIHVYDSLDRYIPSYFHRNSYQPKAGLLWGPVNSCDILHAKHE